MYRIKYSAIEYFNIYQNLNIIILTNNYILTKVFC